MGSFKSVGLLNNQDKMYLPGWETFFPQCLSLLSKSSTLPPLSSLVTIDELAPLQEALEWLGLVRPILFIDSFQVPMPPLPDGELTPLQIFAYLLGHRLRYAQHERDMVVLSHEIITVDPASRHRERTTSTLIAYGRNAGDPLSDGHRPASAMARTVGLPVALAALLVAEGCVSSVGVTTPLTREIYSPILEGLAYEGLRMEENTTRIKDWSPTVEGALRNAKQLRADAGKEPGADPNAHDLDQDPDWVREQQNQA